MSGETEQHVSGWTVDTLKEHLELQGEEQDRRYEQRFEAQEKAVQAALASSKEAVLKAETSTEKRFEGVNEFRAQLADQARDFIPRREAEQALNTLENRIKTLEETRQQEAGRRLATTAIIAVVLVLVAVTGLILAFNN